MSRLDDLASRVFRLSNERDPITGAQAGQEWCEALLPDLSAEREAEWASQVEFQLRELDGIVSAGDHDRGLTAELLGYEMRGIRDDLAARWSEFTVDATFVGPSALLLGVVPKVDLPTDDHLDRYLSRCGNVATYLGQALDRLRGGQSNGRMPTESGIRASVIQLDSYLRSDEAKDPFIVEPALADCVTTAARSKISSVVAAVVRPAVQAYRDALVQEFLPSARSDDQVGIGHLADGPQIYAAALRRHSSTDLTAAEIHQLGLEAIEAIAEEVAQIGESSLGTSRARLIFEHLRAQPDLRFHDATAMVQLCQAALDRAQAVLPGLVQRLPEADCRIETMNATESATGAVGYYQPPATHIGRAGTFWLNVRHPAERPRYEYEALTFHESVPGHHVQTALAQEQIGLADFRRHGYMVAYCEGWALYTERLCDELGLYSSDLDRLGMLSFALWRASRLVVDTGLHHLGWSRSQAIEYLYTNTGLSRDNVVNEIDRYIAWPGQATGYYIGYDRIRTLRELAREAAGNAFDLSAFHSRLLELGPMPLALLCQQMKVAAPTLDLGRTRSRS